MDSIVIKVRLEHAAGIEKEFVGYTSYDVLGQGDFHGVKESTISCIVNYLDFFARREKELPLPDPQFSVQGYTLEGKVTVQDEKQPPLPPLIFEFYRPPQN